MGKLRQHHNGTGQPQIEIVLAIIAILLTVAAFSVDLLTLFYGTVFNKACAVVLKTSESKQAFTKKFTKRYKGRNQTRESPAFHFDTS